MVLTQNRQMGHNVYGRYISCDDADPAEQKKHFADSVNVAVSKTEL